MWYEMLPSLVIVTGLLTIPPYLSFVANKIGYGRKVAKFWEKHSQDYHGYLRDKRLTGSEYTSRGLEGVPRTA